jgi:hypothetical protein
MRNLLVIDATVFLAIAMLSACSSINKITDITDVQPGTAITGVPFRVADNYRLQVYRLQKDGSYKRVHSQSHYLPDQDRVFAASYDAWGLSDHEFKLELNDDNTLKTTSLTSKQKATEAAGAFADEAVARRTAREERSTAASAGATLQRTREADAVDSKGKAAIAQAQLDATLAKADATEIDRVTVQANFDLAKKKANSAAIEAGLPWPYP